MWDSSGSVKSPDPSFGTADAVNHPRVGVLMPAYNSSIGEAKVQEVLYVQGQPGPYIERVWG